MGATLWQQPQKYIQHSAIMFADRIKTPLLLMSGELDTNVAARQAMEMYCALRRLGKDVEWGQNMDGGHVMPTVTTEEVKDYHKRIIDWYDSHLKGDLKKDAIKQRGSLGKSFSTRNNADGRAHYWQNALYRFRNPREALLIAKGATIRALDRAVSPRTL